MGSKNLFKEVVDIDQKDTLGIKIIDFGDWQSGDSTSAKIWLCTQYAQIFFDAVRNYTTYETYLIAHLDQSAP